MTVQSQRTEKHVVGTIRPINILELTPHWDKIIFGIKLSLIGILFRQLPKNEKLWQRSRDLAS